MHLIDWSIMVLPLLICGCIAIYSRRYVRGVADFMAGGRNAGRFLICAARSEQGAGTVVFVAVFQSMFLAGFTQSWWGLFSVPAGLLLSITGFVVYRYRQTRAMTLAQFFEMRYSRNFRLFTGVLGFVAGLVNFGIIPVVGARFMVFFMQLPQTLSIFSHQVPTYLILMGIFLTLCTIMTTVGGQITVLLTDCAEGMFSQIFYVFIAGALLFGFFSWAHTKEMLLDTAPGKSLVNPFDAGSQPFNIWYSLMSVVVGIYGTMAWQNSHAFNSSAATPHESRMGGILGRWRGFAVNVMITLLVISAMTYMHSSEGSTIVNQELARIADPNIAKQMTVPIALAHMLPHGVKGALLSICLMGIIAGDGIHLHSWSSIFVQDVILPLRKTPLSTRQHLLLLRLAIVGVAIFAFIFGAMFPQTDYVLNWWAITMAIFVGGSGAAIIGGLYWSRGTTAGAWTGLLVGSILSCGGIGMRLYYDSVLHREFFLNGMQISFFASLLAMFSYVAVSLLTCRRPHNMDKLLRRGEFAVEPEGPENAALTPRVNWLYRIIGIDHQFSRSDRWITVGIFYWSMFWFAVFCIGSIAYLIHPWSNSTWATYWFIVAICLPLVIGVGTTIWFTIGCWNDMRVFFRRLREETVNEEDDGTVDHSEDAADVPVLAAISGEPLVESEV